MDATETFTERPRMTIDDRIQGFARTVQTRGVWQVTGPICSAVGHCHRYLRFVRVVTERYEGGRWGNQRPLVQAAHGRRIEGVLGQVGPRRVLVSGD